MCVFFISYTFYAIFRFHLNSGLHIEELHFLTCLHRGAPVLDILRNIFDVHVLSFIRDFTNGDVAMTYQPDFFSRGAADLLLQRFLNDYMHAT